MLSTSQVADIFDIDLFGLGIYQVSTGLDNATPSSPFVFTFVANPPPPPTNPRVVLLLHGMNSNYQTWDEFVVSQFGGSSGKILNGAPLAGPAPSPNANGIYCYRLQFGAWDPSSNRTGVESVSAQGTVNYLQDLLKRCGDFETFSQLGDEIDNAVEIITSRHPGAEIILVGHSRGGLAARAFMEGSSPRKSSVTGLLTTSSPHLGSRMGRIYAWLDAHPRNNPSNADDWAVANFLHDNGLDVRRPVIADVTDGSPALVALNAGALNLPLSARYGEIVYNKLALGYLARIPGGFALSIFDPPGPNVSLIVPQMSSAAKSSILGSGQPIDYKGDGLIQAANQVFTQLMLPGKRVVPRRVINDRNVLHTEAPQGSQVTDLVESLRQIGIGWWP